MYSKEELKQLKKEFWEGFGLFCTMIPALKRRKSKFMLYNTKLKGVELKFDANRNGAYVILEINHSDIKRRLEIFKKLEQCKPIMEKDFPDGLTWDASYIRECGTEVSRIYTHKPEIDIHRRIHWISFYKFMSDDMLRLEKAFKKVKEIFD